MHVLLYITLTSVSICFLVIIMNLKINVFIMAIERFSHDLEMKTREQNRNNKQTEIERFDWFIERIQTRVAFGWLSERSGEKTSCPRTFYKSSDTLLWCHTATRLANQTTPSPYKGFLWRENEESMFWSFHPFADKTNNVPLPKPFFKVIRKSL